jgi:hypothetical protein
MPIIILFKNMIGSGWFCSSVIETMEGLTTGSGI